MNRFKRISAIVILVLIILFAALAFTFLAVSGEQFQPEALLFFLIFAILLIVQYALMTSLFKHIDRLILTITDFLIAIGLIIQYRINPEVASKQLMMLAAGMVLMAVCTLLTGKQSFFRRLNVLIMAGSIGMLALLFIIGKEQYGAKNWISLGGASFQPSEFVKVALVFVLANMLTSYRRMRDLWPLLLFVAAVLGLLVLERDLGAALLIGGTALIVFYVATGKKALCAAGVGLGAAGAVASYFIFDHVRIRVAIWQNPWATYSGSGYQIAQGLMAIASGGLWGLGLNQGMPKLIPAYHTDYIFAVICEEFGIIVGLCVIALYLVFIVRGALIALNAPDRYSMIAAFACTVLITLQSFIIIGGVIKLIPLTGITLPFVSHGGSSMIACMMLLGILEGVAHRGGKALDKKAREEEVRGSEA